MKYLPSVMPHSRKGFMVEQVGAALVIGVLLGCLYAVVAIGLSLIFGIIRVINFAHGSMAILFMYLGYYLWALWGIDPYLSIIVVVPGAFALGYGVQYLLIRPMFVREKTYVVEPLGVLLLLAGFDMVVSNGILLAAGPYNLAVVNPWISGVIRWGVLTISVPRLVLALVAIGLCIGLFWLMNRTDLGSRIRAVGQNREAAAICGINVHHIYALAFGLGCAVTAFGGCAMLPFYGIYPGMGMGLAIKAFIIVVLGGLGSVPGALVGGIIIGVVEAVAGQFMAGTMAVIISLFIFLIIVFVRPRGLMGTIEV
jgi:branched-chain amino acid transport system permease protein